MNIVSDCCQSGVVDGIRYEYPLGGRTWREVFGIDVCEDCGQECGTIYICDFCGEAECIGCLEERRNVS